ncbi:MAG: Fe-S protein assembly co-chaperone HscB [Saprospiraceae bacterium]|nr:Fe-S protein assembly co-chaperone HscB [Saprospiraceae bacterium]
MNYFEFYDIPISLKIDEAQLKRTFYKNSKAYHPDFYTLSTEDEKAAMLEQSSLNNEAYKILSDFDMRMKYVLDLFHSLADEGKNTIPQDFLVDMMDINEGLMELEFEFDAAKFNTIIEELERLEKELYQDIAPIVEAFNPEKLEIVKKYYLKKKYLLRIRENLLTFAVR